MHYYSPKDIARYILSCSDHEISTLTIEGIAQSFDCEMPTLLREFEVYLQISLNDYLCRERVYRAAHKLRKHNVKSLEKLSFSLGFNNMNKFTLEFKRFFNIEPQRYFYLMEVKRFKQNFYNHQKIEGY